jgi:transcription elongation factor S-II
MGLFVNKMKAHSDSHVSKLAKDIVRAWKAQVAKEAGATGGALNSSLSSNSSIKQESSKSESRTLSSSIDTDSTSRRPTVDTRPSSTSSKGQYSSREGSSTASSPRTPTDVPKDRTVRSDGMRIKTTGNDVRDRCIEMLYQALGTNSNAGTWSVNILYTRFVYIT